MTDQLPTPPESLQAAAASLGYDIRPRNGGGWTVYLINTDFVVTWMGTDEALARYLALGGAQFGETK